MRDHARVRISLAEDNHFEELSMDAQWLYIRVLVPEPSLSYCGIADWRPKRLLGKSMDMTMDRLLDAAAELERERFSLFDLTTEEVLVRSYIRSDEILRNPKMVPAVLKAYRLAASKQLRAAVVSECLRAKEQHPEFSSWTHVSAGPEMAKLLARPSSKEIPYVSQYGDRIGNATNSDYQSDSAPIPSLPSPPSLLPTPLSEKSAPAGPPSKRGTRIAEDWQPNEKTLAWARQKYPTFDLDEQREAFIDHYRQVTGAKGTSLDWNGAFKGWLRKAESFGTGEKKRNGSRVDQNVNDWFNTVPTTQPQWELQ